MRDEFSLDPHGAATVRLLGGGWADGLQQVCARLKSAGERHRLDGQQALVRRLRRTRPSTYEHCVRVARLSRLTGRALGFDAPRLQQLSSTAMMHDIGKILVPESVLNRPRKPTRFEQFLLHLHPSLGALLASYFNLSAELRVRTEHHHERWDGRGYPHRLGSTDIPLMARVVQVADTYDAMTSKRSYNRPVAHADAVRELRAECGKQFDPRVVEAFLDAYSSGGDAGLTE
jgi:HD-GYP domain-containing protein (c-di-GMP phosphodiesterase class II)